MTKSLEALEKFKLLYESKCKSPNNLIGFDMCYITIKQDLERLEKLENYPPEFDGFLYSFEGLIERNKKLEDENQELKEELLDYQELHLINDKRIVKLKKAIEILKSYLFVSDEVDFDTFTTSRLTQQEYELLKEVLENVG